MRYNASCVAVVGNRFTVEMSGMNSLPEAPKARSELITVRADVEPTSADAGDRDEYYHSVGRQNAMAFNRHAFSSRSARSFTHNIQPF